MLRRLVPLLLAYGIFLGSHSLLYSVFLHWVSPVSVGAILAFVAAVLLASGALFLAEKCFGILPAEILPVSAGKLMFFRYLWCGFWGLFCVNCVLSLLFSTGKEGHIGTESLLRILSAAVIHPVGEEILFRRLFLPRIGTYLPRNAAIPVQAILFAITHYTSGTGNMLYALAGGMILGTIYDKTGKLYIPILIHGAVNLLGLFLPVSVLSVAGGASFGILLISLLCSLLFRKRKETRV